jgi:hypothetical protein
MPTVDFDKVPEKHREVMECLVEHNRLVVMPKFDCNDHTKLIHHFLLKMMKHDTRWSVPIYHTWYMPHLIKVYDDKTLRWVEDAAWDICISDCFGSPQPVYIGDKQYFVTREDGTTFVMKVS